MSATTSTTIGSMLPPPPPRTEASSQGTEIHVARDVIPTRNVQGSGPVLASNEEILNLFGSVQEQMRQQQETNQMLMREIPLVGSFARPNESFREVLIYFRCGKQEIDLDTASNSL